MGGTRSGSRKSVLISAVMALCLAALAIAPAAGADSFGQVGSYWGKFGTGNVEFQRPSTFGVDPVDGSVYVGDEVTSENFRIQKLSPTGTFGASALISKNVEPARLRDLHGIAVDHERGLFYLISGCRAAVETVTPCTSPGGRFAATKILIFKTTPTGTTLEPAATPSLSLPSGANELYKPQNIAVDPTNHDLVILAEEKEGHAVIQRFNEETGESIARFVDTTNILKPGGTRKASSIAVAPDHTTYTITGLESAPGAANTRAWQLPENLSSLTEVSGFKAAAESENWTNGLSAYQDTLLSAPQIAISPDGDTLYWKEVAGVSSETEAGSIVVRGYSLSEGGTTRFYGGVEEGPCEILTNAAGIATTTDKVVLMDFGPRTETGAPPYGDRVVTFGPGGSGCPVGPKPKLKVDGSEEAAVTVNKGEEVAFDGSGSEPNGQTIAEVVWNFGDGTIQKVTSGGPTETNSHTFGETGTYTVKFRLRPQNPNIQPGVVERTVTVVAPTGPHCTGLPINGRGTMLQQIAQQEIWAPAFSSTICPSGPSVGYNATGTTAGKEWNQYGTTGTINAAIQFIGTDVAPTPAQVTNIRTAAGGADVTVIPVAQTSIAIVANPPAGCEFEEEAGITNVELQRLFRGSIREWSGLSSVTGSCNSPITRVVSRKDGTGTTDQFKNYLSRMNGSTLPCVNKTWQELRPLVPPSGEPNTVWPQSCTGTTLSPVLRPSTNDDGAIVDTVNANEGAIGYAATPSAESHFSEGTTVIVPLQDNGQAGAAVFATPAAAGQANCGSMTYNIPSDGRRRPGATGLNVDWTGVSGAQPGIGGGAYPLCMLTYALAFHGYSSAGFVWGKFLTTYDYLRQYLVADAGQEALEAAGRYYAPLPTSGQNWKDVGGAARYAAGKISWQPGSGGGGPAS